MLRTEQLADLWSVSFGSRSTLLLFVGLVPEAEEGERQQQLLREVFVQLGSHSLQEQRVSFGAQRSRNLTKESQRNSEATGQSHLLFQRQRHSFSYRLLLHP